MQSDAFFQAELRVGRVVSVEPFPEARKPAYKLVVDFGEGLGEKRSSAQLTDFYSPDDLLGRQVVAVTNLPPRLIGGFVSEVLVLGVPGEEGGVVLLEPERPVAEGVKVY
ncbi:tRNA-binding protein [Desulfohalovibrio reitneri]|uniref:tRNA-binding protein n=1 Tax=Desulfohalovibrio reitneri TaxID=1307759 RepID=UPI0004A77188|nr:tRNA-binding protein [Desulfohalovibrio reitneri]